jgi:hypothetical protein
MAKAHVRLARKLQEAFSRCISWLWRRREMEFAMPQRFEHPRISCFFVKNFTYFLRQTAKGEWFAQQVDPRIKPTVVDYRVACVAGCE